MQMIAMPGCNASKMEQGHICSDIYTIKLWFCFFVSDYTLDVKWQADTISKPFTVRE